MRYQSGPYEKALDAHEVTYDLELRRVEGWRAAMRAVADLAGFVFAKSSRWVCYDHFFFRNIFVFLVCLFISLKMIMKRTKKP